MEKDGEPWVERVGWRSLSWAEAGIAKVKYNEVRGYEDREVL
jgi:hypothetical protein